MKSKLELNIFVVSDYIYIYILNCFANFMKSRISRNSDFFSWNFSSFLSLKRKQLFSMHDA